MKELQVLNKSYLAFMSFGGAAAGVEKHMRKMIRKCLMLTVDGGSGTQSVGGVSIMTARLPSHLHLASIMNEKTYDEKLMFGSVNLSEH